MKSKTELNKKAQELNALYDVSIIYGTSDGQFFLEKNRAYLHSGAKKLAVYEFPKDGTVADAVKTVINAATLPSPEFRAKDEKELEKNRDKKEALSTVDQEEKGNDNVNPQEEEAEALKAKETAIELLKSDSDLNLLEYKTALQLAKDLGLNIENKKLPTLLTALLAERENLKNQENG